MIVTVTMNPAIDKTVELDTFVHGGLNRIKYVEYDAGGKGINVSKTIRELGGTSIATGFLGGNTGRTIEQVLREKGIESDFVHVEQETRTNTKVFETNGDLTELNEPGPVITAEAQKQLLAKLEGYAAEDTLFVLSGSIPAGIDVGIYGEIVRLVHAKGSTVLLDADGELFRRGLEASPDIIKPNRMELEGYAALTGKAVEAALHDEAESAGDSEKAYSGETAFGETLPAGMISGITSEETSLLEIAGKLKRQGIHQIAISMGKDGALFLLGDTPVRCPALSVKAHSPVGAGDAMVAALALAWERKFDETETIKLCMAASAGAVMTIGTKPPTAELVEELKQQVLCEKIDLRQGNCTDTDLDVKLAGCADTDVQTARSVASQSGNLSERFEFRSIGPDEAEQAAEIERICFPPNEACSRPMMLARVAKAPELFLVAVDRQTGRLAALLNGLSTNEQTFRDEFFTDADLYDPDGDTIMILGLDVLPQYRMQGLARELVRRYMERERENGRKQLLLTCLDAKVEMYQKMGFCDDGIADSSWGGEEWHQMSCSLL